MDCKLPGSSVHNTSQASILPSTEELQTQESNRPVPFTTEQPSEVKWSEVKVAQSCTTLCDPRDYTVHEILLSRILEWAAFPFSRASSQPRNQSGSPALQADSLPAEPPGKPKNTGVGSLSLLQWIFSTQESIGVSCIAGDSFTNWAIRPPWNP